MNGEQQNFIKELDKRIRNYDKRIAIQEQINKQQQEMSKNVFDKLDKLPCDVHSEKMNNLEVSTNRIWNVLIWGVIVVVLGTVVKIMLNGAV